MKPMVNIRCKLLLHKWEYFTCDEYLNLNVRICKVCKKRQIRRNIGRFFSESYWEEYKIGR